MENDAIVFCELKGYHSIVAEDYISLQSADFKCGICSDWYTSPTNYKIPWKMVTKDGTIIIDGRLK